MAVGGMLRRHRLRHDQTDRCAYPGGQVYFLEKATGESLDED